MGQLEKERERERSDEMYEVGRKPVAVGVAGILRRCIAGD